MLCVEGPTSWPPLLIMPTTICCVWRGLHPGLLFLLCPPLYAVCGGAYILASSSYYAHHYMLCVEGPTSWPPLLIMPTSICCVWRGLHPGLLFLLCPPLYAVC